jgi:hypothetical protein
VLYALHETREVEGVGMMLDLARDSMGCSVTDEVVGEGIGDCKGGDAVAEEHGDNEAGVHGSG